MFKHILVATDGSPAAVKAVQLALQMAGKARVTALLVVPDYTTAEFARAVFADRPDFHALRPSLLDKGRAWLEAALAHHGEAAKEVERCVVIGNRPHEEIVAAAQREQCDLIVMGSRGLGTLASALVGSQTQRVLDSATVPVLVVPRA